MARDRDGHEEIRFMGEENIKEDMWTGGRARNMELLEHGRVVTKIF
jgi:hypothetical protein